MTQQTFEPPICPICENPLSRVFENVYETYTFNPETGTYKETGGDMDIKCPECGGNLYDVFEDGACNYDAKSQPRNSQEAEG